jgi:Protein of unknown function (DUF3999)
MRQLFVFIVFFVASSLGVSAAEKPADFAYGITIDASGSEALYEVTLPPSVYQGVTQRDLTDVRVFNGAGEVVPHAWRPRRTEKAEAGATLPLTLFPLKAAAGANLDALSIRVNRSAGGANNTISVDVKSGGAAPASAQQVVAYLIDLTAQERALRAIDLDWKAGDGFAGKLRVDASDDLSQWQSLVSGAPLLNLEVGGQRLQQKRVELPQRKAKYLRLAWVHDSAKFTSPDITAATGELADKFVEAPREWMPMKAENGAKEGEYLFNFKGFYPANRIKLSLPETNTIAQLEVLVRDNADQPWRSVARGVAYRLNQPGGEVFSPDFNVSAGAARWWMVRVDQRGGGIGSSLPTLSAGWVPHQLVFAARGAPPFTLAYGNQAAKPAALAIESLIPGYREDAGATVRAAKASGNVTVNVQAAAAQGQKELGGAVRLEKQVDWKRWTLWGALALGVLVLGVMAWRLMRQLGATGGAGGVDKR